MSKDELEKCIDIHGTDIYAFCQHLACNQSEAQDLYQDTFVKAMELIEKLDSNQNIKSYLISIALRIWKNKKRKFAWRKRIADTRTYVEEVDEASEQSIRNSPEEEVLSREEKRMVQKAVEHLPEKYRIPILLYYMEECSIEEIGHIMDIPTGTVKSRLYAARKLLKEELEVFISEA